MRKLLVSTGTMVGRLNGYDYKAALNEISRLYSDGFCEGLELMMLPFYYDKRSSVLSAVRECGVSEYVIHCDKDVGTYLSDAGMAKTTENTDNERELYKKAIDLFRENCIFAEELGINRMVIHLWGGYSSDKNIGYNIEAHDVLRNIAKQYGVRLLIENVPSQRYDPRSNWHSLLSTLGDSGFVFDTRFGCLHAQSADILTDEELIPRIEHIHISDFGGEYRDFGALRPILHPGEGKVDFDEISHLVDRMNYDGTITLESPIMVESGWDFVKQRRTLEYLHELFHI